VTTASPFPVAQNPSGERRLYVTSNQCSPKSRVRQVRAGPEISKLLLARKMWSKKSEVQFFYRRINRVKPIYIFGLVAIVVSWLPVDGRAAGEGDLARATQNPVSDLTSLPFQNNTNFDVGPEGKTQNILNIQPVWPVSLNDEWNLITRTILPVVSQTEFAPGDGRTNGIGDTTFTAFFSPKKPTNGLIWGAGPVVLLPTASDDVLGSDKWGIGPSAVFLTMKGPWVIGSLFNNVGQWVAVATRMSICSPGSTLLTTICRTVRT